ncbi:MAG TPA: hypothetical protein VJR29_08455, partial [bacterium]|nr:hypothetical protein [bacterium]
MKKNSLLVLIACLAVLAGGSKAGAADLAAADVPLSVNSITAMMASPTSSWTMAYQDREQSYEPGEFDQYHSSLTSPKLIQVWEEKTATSEGAIRWKYRANRDGGVLWILPVSGLATVKIYPVGPDGKIPMIEYEEDGETKTKQIDPLKTIKVDERGIQLVTDASAFKMDHPVFGPQGNLETSELLYTHTSNLTLRFTASLGGGFDIADLPSGPKLGFKNPEPVACVHGCPDPEGEGPAGGENPGAGDPANGSDASIEGSQGGSSALPTAGGCSLLQPSAGSGSLAGFVAGLVLLAGLGLRRR